MHFSRPSIRETRVDSHTWRSVSPQHVMDFLCCCVICAKAEKTIKTKPTNTHAYFPGGWLKKKVATHVVQGRENTPGALPENRKPHNGTPHCARLPLRLRIFQVVSSPAYPRAGVAPQGRLVREGKFSRFAALPATATVSYRGRLWGPRRGAVEGWCGAVRCGM